MMSTNWDLFVRKQARAHILQLSAWGTLKSAFGWSATQVEINDNGHIIAGAQILFRSLPFHLGTMAYIPMAPYIKHNTPDTEKHLWNLIDTEAKKTWRTVSEVGTRDLSSRR